MPPRSNNVLLGPGRRVKTEPISVMYITESPDAMKHPFEYPGYPAQTHESSGSPVTPLPGRKWTQEDQDERDAEMRKEVMGELVQSWMDRLQLISVITTFFAAVEGGLLGIATPERGIKSPPIERAATTGLSGALVLHLFAAIISFLASFFLIRYKVEEAKIEEKRVEEGVKPTFTGIWSSNPRLEQFGPFQMDKPPTVLLERCHSLCILFAAVGFVLAIVGVICFMWARMMGSPSIFATVCAGVCFAASFVIIFLPSSTTLPSP